MIGMDWKRGRFFNWLRQLGSTRYRGIFIACLVTLGVSGGVAGTVLFVRWQADHFAGRDSRTILDQTAQQLTQEIQSRRRMLTLLRDALDKSPRLTDAEQAALLKSAIGYTPDLVGGGLIQRGTSFAWWVPPAPLTLDQLAGLNREILRRTWLRVNFKLPSMRTFFLTGDRPILVMIEPFRSRPKRTEMIIAVFDLKALLEALFKKQVQPLPAMRLMEGSQLLHSSRRWPFPSRSPAKTVVERGVPFEGGEWVLQIQTRPPSMVPRSWLNLLVGVVLLLAALAAVGMVWTAERLRQMATTDELTGLYNRRFFLERLGIEVERAKRYGRNLSCLMIDVNGFKRINDSLGHPMGDWVLRQTAQALKARLRQTDLLARFGGDEFVVALPETDLARARQVEEKLRQLSIEGPWEHPALPGPVRLSIGVGHLEARESGEEILKKADADLYASRETADQGR
ncbi:MAG: GGDEF domain-containing protein [Candidatus Omnitrophica bacterium]|nr:GGDEF domain-containing protein [Candidatus Omnitrophota bacterium]